MERRSTGDQTVAVPNTDAVANAVTVADTITIASAVAVAVGMSDCCLQGIQPCKCKGEGRQCFGNQVFR